MKKIMLQQQVLQTVYILENILFPQTGEKTFDQTQPL